MKFPNGPSNEVLRRIAAGNRDQAMLSAYVSKMNTKNHSKNIVPSRPYFDAPMKQATKVAAVNETITNVIDSPIHFFSVFSQLTSSSSSVDTFCSLLGSTMKSNLVGT